MHLVKLRRYVPDDVNHDYLPVYVNPDDVSWVTDNNDPTVSGSFLVFKHGHELGVVETAVEVALLLGYIARPPRSVRRYRDRRTTFAAARTEAWKHFEEAHYELSEGTCGDITKQQIHTPCTASNYINLFVGDGPTFRIYDLHTEELDSPYVACYSAKEQQLFVLPVSDVLKVQADPDGARIINPLEMDAPDLIRDGDVDCILATCGDDGRAREACHYERLAQKEEAQELACLEAEEPFSLKDFDL